MDARAPGTCGLLWALLGVPALPSPELGAPTPLPRAKAQRAIDTEATADSIVHHSRKNASKEEVEEGKTTKKRRGLASLCESSEPSGQRAMRVCPSERNGSSASSKKTKDAQNTSRGTPQRGASVTAVEPVEKQRQRGSRNSFGSGDSSRSAGACDKRLHRSKDGRKKVLSKSSDAQKETAVTALSSSPPRGPQALGWEHD